MHIKMPILYFAITPEGEEPLDSDWRALGSVNRMSVGGTHTYYPMRGGIQKVVVKKKLDAKPISLP